MIPYFEIDSFSLGPITINVWGLLVAAGLLVGVLLSMSEAKRKKQSVAIILDLAIVIIVSAFVGARIFYVLNEWSQFQNQPLDIIKLWEGGLGIYGGLVGAVFAGWLYLKIKKFPFWAHADTIIFSLPLGLAVGRLGCFFVHDHLGKLTTVPWGVKLADGTSRHDMAFYEIIFGLVVFMIFWRLRKATFIADRPGWLSGLFFVLYGIFRFVADFWRATDLIGSDPLTYFNLHPSQWFSIVTIICGLLVIFLVRPPQSNKV
ncbi:MAG: prolipoprotein diacylglyceryl transferase [Patescibacteria group bacterium]